MSNLDPDLLALQAVRDAMGRAVAAQSQIAQATQEQTDRLCRAVSRAASGAAADLARLAVEETGIGRVHYKVLKNLFAAEGIWESIKAERTVGVLSRDASTGVIEVATPIGVIAGIVPTTNPTSTAIGKALIALKGRNAIVISPHPRAKRCIAETVEVMRRALEREGAPADLVQVLASPTIESTNALMRHPALKLILATGGAGLVQAAYSSGKPAYGVGPGNVPCYVDRTADLERAARWVTASQSFDNATLCCSEQALVLDAPIAERLLGALADRGAHRCSPEEIGKLERYCNRDGHMNPDVVGLDPWKVAEGAGFKVPRSTTILLAEQNGVGAGAPLSIEILCPLLSVHRVDGWEQGCATSHELLKLGGLGHTVGVWSGDETVLEAWALHKPASRIVFNGPTSQGAVGYSTGLAPSMSLGCGPLAGNITSDNITARHMINVKRVGQLESDFEERYAADVARAAELLGVRDGGDLRGSGLAGDPGLRSGGGRSGGGGSGSGLGAGQALSPQRSAPAFSSPAVSSNWQGNPPLESAEARPVASPARPSSPLVSSPSVSSSAPRPGGQVTPLNSTPAVPVAAGGGGGRGATPRIADAIGAPLPPDGGQGCPLGPCQGCPHQDVRTRSCTA